MFVLRGLEPGGSAETRTHARTRSLTHSALTLTWHSQKTNTGSNGANGASLPVTPNAVGQFHESEGEVQAEEEKQVSRGFIRQNRPEK